MRNDNTMKNKSHHLVFGRDTRLSGALALGFILLVALGCTCGKDFNLGNLSSGSNSNSSSNSIFGTDSDTDSADADETLIKATIKSTTATFANAISTEDFSKLYADTAQEFKDQYTEEQLKSEFADFIRQKRQLLPILAKTVSLDPVFDEDPSTRTEGSHTLMTASGKYETSPLPVTFKYEYVKRGGSWKLLKLEIYVK